MSSAQQTQPLRVKPLDNVLLQMADIMRGNLPLEIITPHVIPHKDSVCQNILCFSCCFSLSDIWFLFGDILYLVVMGVIIDS